MTRASVRRGFSRAVCMTRVSRAAVLALTILSATILPSILLRSTVSTSGRSAAATLPAARRRRRSAGAGGAVSPAEISSLDISLSEVMMFSLRQTGQASSLLSFLLWLARLRRDRLDPGARRCRESFSARYHRKPGAHVETDERHCPSLLLGASLLGAVPLQHVAPDDGRRWPRGQPTLLQLRPGDRGRSSRPGRRRAG